MGFNIKRLFRSRETPVEGAVVEKVTAIDILDQSIQEAAGNVFLRELAFWTCVEKIGNMLSKCEFRTFVEGKEVFGDEYYLWNYQPNKNQNKSEFLKKAIEKLYRTNELLVIESYDGQLFVADSFNVHKNTLYGDSYTDVVVDDYTFPKVFCGNDVLHWKLNNKNINTILQGLYSSYGKLIDYSSQKYLKSRGNRGTLEISAVAQNDINFSEKLQKLLNDYFKTFFNSDNAVLPLFEGYKYNDLGSKTYSEGTTRDIKNQYDDIFDFTARGFSIPPALAKGDVQDTSKAVDEMLTFCLDPLADMLQVEINRKRNGTLTVKNGTRLQISTIKAKHIDIFDVATPVEKLVGSGVCTINMILRVIGESQIDEDWANQHFMTKNFSTIQDLLEIIQGKEEMKNE